MERVREQTEVSSKPTRRKFTAEFKRRILDETGRATGEGEIGRILRREGLYSSHVTRWRDELAHGELEPKKRGRKAQPIDERTVRIAELERELEVQRRRADRAELLVEIQKKVSQLLGIELAQPPKGEK